MHAVGCGFDACHFHHFSRRVAQSGSAPGLGPGGPRFEPLHADHNPQDRAALAVLLLKPASKMWVAPELVTGKLFGLLAQW